jgi:hypothetical protein
MNSKKHQTLKHFLLKQMLVILLSFNCFSGSLLAQLQVPGFSKPLKWQEEGIRIYLEDHLKVPEMSWPLTLLEYPVDFTSGSVIAKELVLIERISDRSFPFQLTSIEQENGKIKKAVLCFFSDLPSGSRKEFHLVRKKGQSIPKPQALTGVVKVSSRKEETLITNGSVSVKIPAPGEYTKQVPPFLQIGNAKQWLGHSELPEGLQMEKMQLTALSVGDLLAEYLFDYRFRGGKNFQLRIRLAAGQDFLELEESITGFTEKDSLAWKIVWDNFEPEYRYCPNRPGEPAHSDKEGYDSYEWEPITGTGGDPLAVRHPDLPYDQNNLADGRQPMKIAPYHNWRSWWRLPVISFWNKNTGQTAGIFIKDFEKWVDPNYPLWGSKEYLSVLFYYKDGFTWSFPLLTGKRSLGLAIYPHKKDIDLVDRINQPQIYVNDLFRWQGYISLNKVKDWILDYGSGKPDHQAFFKSPAQEVSFNEKELLSQLNRMSSQMAVSDARSSGWPSPVSARTFYGNTTPSFENSEGSYTEDEYREARANYLFHAYLFMDETLMPMKNMLSGHPNFLADVKGVPGLAAFLFPDHPHAGIMADHFEKSVALNLRYHTRPNEPAWEARGGRWTENLACYTWAFLKPTLWTSYVLHHAYDGKNRMLQPNIRIYTDWLLNGLTSPLDTEQGLRVIPPQGAHSRNSLPPNLLYILGQEIYHYDPLLAEHIFHVTSPDAQAFESHGRPNSFDGPAKTWFKDYGKGTNPRLKSAKYTGYGINLRKNFGEPDEIYVHLQQIDEGPNYRWGRAAKGGNGVIYYYAEGKRYSHNGIEDVGDAPFGDMERCTNFGVKNEKGCYRCIGDYRSVGMNDLTEPLYDFGFAQFATILANNEASPEYRSRSVLMSGNDYILIFDDVMDNSVEGRLSWFVGKEDDFPFIHQLKPGIRGADANIQPSKTPYHDDRGVISTKGRYYDGKGDFLTLVTHRDWINPVFEGGICRVDRPDGSREWVFRDDQSLVFGQGEMVFEGSAGMIRQSADKKLVEAALFQGTKVGIPGIVAEFAATPKHGGMSVKNTPHGFSGIIQVREKTTVKFTLTAPMKELVFYLDGTEMALTPESENAYLLVVPAGKHNWQWTSAGVIPVAPAVKSSISGATWCELEWPPVPGALSYSIQKSTDGGINWINMADNIQGTKYRVSGLTDGKKVHIRVSAKGRGGIGEPSGDYPVYPTSALPHQPEGLRLMKSGGEVSLNWGQVLGADQYTLYQREKGATEYCLIYSGTDCNYNTKLADEDRIYEFSVTASNGNGESARSIPADTDESRLINWYPVPGEIFRRDTESHENGYHEYNHWKEQEMPVLKYPFQEK